MRIKTETIKYKPKLGADKRLYRLKFFNPEIDLRNLGYNDKYIAKQTWKYDYLLTKILMKYHRTTNGYVRLSTEELKNKLDKIQIKGIRREAYLRIRDDLRKLGILLFQNKREKLGEKTYTERCDYKIKDEALVKGYSKVDYQITDWIKYKMDLFKFYKGTVYYNILNSISKVNIDEVAARNFINICLVNEKVIKPKKVNNYWVERTFNDEVASHYHMAVDNIVDGYYELKVDTNTGRVFNYLTSFPKALRKYLSINGETLIELDTSNSQPLIFCINLIDWCNEMGYTDRVDVSEFIRLCEKGKFYKYIIDIIESTGEEIKEEVFKPDFFAKIFFSSEKIKYYWRTLFEDKFPTVSEAITHFKKEGYEKLAIQLQKTESSIFTNSLPKTLYKEGITDFFTLHDAVYCLEKDADRILEVIHSAFKEKGLNPRIKKNILENDMKELDEVIKGTESNELKRDYANIYQERENEKLKRKSEAEKEKEKEEFNDSYLASLLGAEIV